MSATLDTTKDTEGRVPLVESRGAVHLATACWSPACRNDVHAAGHRRSFGSVSALTCPKCRRRFDREQGR